jgi:erythromycin esterase
LDLSGFDLQFTGSASTDHLLMDLDAFLARCRLDPAAAAAADRVQSVLALVLKDPGYIARGSGFQSAKPEDRSAALAAARGLGESLAALSFSGEPERFERDFWIQLIASCASFLEMSWGIDPLAMDAAARDRAINIRDRQMAENLLWLANRAYSGRKIIVWTATGHVLHRRFSPAGAPGPTVPMGEWIDRALGSEVYSVGFAAYEGWWGTVEMPAPEEVPPAAPNSLEELLSSAGFSFAFLDLRAVGAEGVWLKESLLCRALRYMPVAADWTRLLDGIFFIRETSPSLRSDPLRFREESSRHGIQTE